MLPFLFTEETPFENGDYIYIPNVADGIRNKAKEFTAYVVKNGEFVEFTLEMADLTDDEREIILNGCLINYNRNKK
jgi:aconitate hydratase